MKNVADLNLCHLTLSFLLTHSTFKSAATEMRPLRLSLMAEHRRTCAKTTVKWTWL